MQESCCNTPALDVCCGPKMMWFDKHDPRVTFLDKRDCDYHINPDKAYPSGSVISVKPDLVADFTALPFPDQSFHHVVFDPPHVIRQQLLGTVTKKYGALTHDWKPMIQNGFQECFRVLKTGGTLIFKWCEVDIPLNQILELAPQQPLYGHRSGKKAATHWIAFLKS